MTEALTVIDQPVFRSREGPRCAHGLAASWPGFAADLAQPGGHAVPRHRYRHRRPDQSVADLRDDLLRRISAVLRSGLAQAEATGEPGRRLDPDELLARLLGPVIFRVSIEQAVADRAFIDRLVDAALDVPEG